ncbi:MAG: chemotaxis protein CheW [Chloroflexi bacterium]|nr:chemotaxis protein CheW [Chloroflexota bacterium]
MLSRGRCQIPLAALYEVVRPPHSLALLPAIPRWMPGVVAWRGETIAVIDLDMYLSGSAIDSSAEGTLLIANHTNHASLPIGLLVPAIEQTPLFQPALVESPPEEQGTLDETTAWYLPSRAAFVKGVQAGALILDVPSLLADVVQQISLPPAS